MLQSIELLYKQGHHVMLLMCVFICIYININFRNEETYFFSRASLASSNATVSTDSILTNIGGSNTNTNNVNSAGTSSNSVFSNFGHEVGGNSGVSVSVITSDSQPPSLLEDNVKVGTSNAVVTVTSAPRHSPVIQHLHSPHPSESVMKNDDMTQPGMIISHENKSVNIEPTNVCKVSTL